MDSKRADDWLNKANSDMTGANILFQYNGGYDLVTFHCQQAIEKALKGWILRKNGELLEGHSLIYLCKAAIKSGAKLSNHLKDCAYVNQFYIETRYPADTPLEITEEEAKDCIEIAQKILVLLDDNL